MGRSRVMKPTWNQKALMSKAGLAVNNWLVLEETKTELRLVRRRCKTDNKKVLIEVGASIRTSIGPEALYQSSTTYKYSTSEPEWEED